MKSHAVFDLAINVDFTSPNFNNRSGPISMVVIHYTAMVPTEPVLRHFEKAESQVSAHYVIGEDGRVYRMVDERSRAWHAGVAHWHGFHDVNGTSIGIELVNPGFGPEYRNFSEPQINSLTLLLGQIVPQYDILPWNIVGHEDVAPGRKQDPGHRFPWAHLAEAGFGLWPRQPTDDTLNMNMSAFYEHLIRYGYTGLAPDATDTEKKATTLAFQRHFQPELFPARYDEPQPLGSPDGVTMSRLNDLLEQKAKWRLK